MSDYSFTIEALQLSDNYLETQNGKLLISIKELECKRTELEIFTKMTHALDKRSNTDLRIEDEETKKLAIFIHRYDPKILEDWVDKFPEGTLIEPMRPSGTSFEDFLNAAASGLTLSEVEFSPIPYQCIDAIIQRLVAEREIIGTQVTQLVNDTQRIYGDQSQIVDIMSDIIDQNKSIMDLINSHMRG